MEITSKSYLLLYKDRMIIFQVLKYMVNIWESKIQADKDERKELREANSGEIELPIILPLVVYHDKGEWNIKRTLYNVPYRVDN